MSKQTLTATPRQHQEIRFRLETDETDGKAPWAEHAGGRRWRILDPAAASFSLTSSYEIALDNNDANGARSFGALLDKLDSLEEEAAEPTPHGDNAAGAVRLLREESDLPFDGRILTTPDPIVPGAWLVEAPECGWRAVVYVGSHPDAPDFEQVDPPA